MAKYIPESFAAPLFTIVLITAASCNPVDSSERSSQRADAIRRTECNRVGNEREVVLGQASVDEEYVLTLTARSVSRTLWEQAGNEALILEVSGRSGLIGTSCSTTVRTSLATRCTW